VTAELVKNHADWKPGFKQASVDLKALSAKETIGIADVLSIINRLPQLQTEDAAIFINGTVIIFSDELSAMSFKTPEQLRNAVIGLYQGIDLATP
jgi:hypothetical protein